MKGKYLTPNERLGRLQSFAIYFSDWTPSNIVEIREITELTSVELKVCLNNGLIERRISEQRIIGKRYDYIYKAENPPNLKTAKRLSELMYKYQQFHNKADVEQVHVQKEVVRVDEKEMSLDDRKALAIGHYIMKLEEQAQFTPSRDMIRSFIEGFEAAKEI